MAEKTSFFVLREKAVPEVLLKVVEAKRLLDSGKVESVQDATEASASTATNEVILLLIIIRFD